MYCDEESDTETCQAMETARDIDLIEDRPDWCPLRELPEKKELYLSINKWYCVGFNDCLDDILGETHGKEKL
jgi:hypothetical protein